MQRDNNGKFVKGNHYASPLNTPWLVPVENTNELKEAVKKAVTPDMIQEALRDVFESAKSAKTYRDKVALWQLFFDRVLGKPGQEMKIQEQKIEAQVNVDYSNYSLEELDRLQKLYEGNAIEINEETGNEPRTD